MPLPCAWGARSLLERCEARLGGGGGCKRTVATGHCRPGTGMSLHTKPLPFHLSPSMQEPFGDHPSGEDITDVDTGPDMGKRG